MPIYKTDDERATVLESADRVRKELAAAGIRVHLDARDGMKPGAKYYEWEGRGVPLRLEIGPRDVGGRHRDAGAAHRRQEGEPARSPGWPAALTAAMETMQRDLLETARARREANSIRGATKEQFLAQLEAGGGFIYAGFCGRNECEMEIKEQTKATIRVLPDEEFRSPQVPATCMWCGRPSVTEAVWARAY